MLNIQADKILPNLFDKLTDEAPNNNIQESLLNHDTPIKRYKDTVLRDLIALLNSNITIPGKCTDKSTHIKKSTIAYGMRSLVGTRFSDSNKQQLIKEIKKALLNFEPRICQSSLKVELVKGDNGIVESNPNHKIKINITGILRPLQRKEKIYVKTEIDLETGRFELVT